MSLVVLGVLGLEGGSSIDISVVNLRGCVAVVEDLGMWGFFRFEVSGAAGERGFWWSASGIRISSSMEVNVSPCAEDLRVFWGWSYRV